MADDAELADARAERDRLLPDLWAQIARMGQNDSMFWLCEILLHEIARETGYSGPSPSISPFINHDGGSHG